MSYPYPPPQNPGYYPPPPQYGGAPPPGAPYGAPPSPHPPPGGHYPPPSPQTHYGQPGPGLAPPQGYGAPPSPVLPARGPSPQPFYPPQQPQRASSPHVAPGFGGPPPGPGYPAPGPGFPPPMQGYPPPQYPYPPPGPGGPPPPMGYGPPPPGQPPYGGHGGPPPATYDPTADINAIVRACKGFGTDEATLINIFSTRTGPQIDAIRNNYLTSTGKDLIDVLHSETSGDFRFALKALALGPTESEVFFLRQSIVGAGTHETLMTECLVGKSNAQINALKTFYQRRYKRDLVSDVKGDLSGKTEQFFTMVLSAQRQEEWQPVTPNAVLKDVQALYRACKGLGTDETTVSSIMTHASDVHIRLMDMEYKKLYGKDLCKLMRSEFSGHLLTALLYLIEGALDRVKRDAERMEHAMKGMGTKDQLLVARLVRAHWDKPNMGMIKSAYRQFYGRELSERVRGETSGDYGRLLVSMINN